MESILESPLVIVQGITGHHGSFHTEKMLSSGTRIVAGVTPGKGGQSIHGVPVYNSVREAVNATLATASVIFVPAKFAKNAMFEAIDAGIKIIVCITEGIPVHDMLEVHQKSQSSGVTIIGPNCPGYIVPGSHKLGIIASHITSPGHTTIISRSGTLTYELADALTKKAIGQRLILGIGGDPVQGMTFVDALKLAEADPRTKQIVIIGEIGGEGENLAADYVKNHVSKPVYGLVVGHSLPPGQTFGHAGAIVSHHGETAQAKTEYMVSKGVLMSQTLDELISSIKS
jgi:succinyl-CoA synthetase alpha subunit